VKILFLGDIVGRAGRDAVIATLPGLRRDLALDLVIANAENATHGFGLSPDNARTLFDAGCDCLTLGNHAWDRKEVIPYIETEPRLLRPLNFPAGTPGRGAQVIESNGKRTLVVNLMARLFMDALDDPFAAIRAELARHGLGRTVDAIVVDLHGEASSEKQAFGHYVDGMVSIVVGTHTHVPTADARILARGTAYQTDAGMCGDFDSVIGMAKEGSLARFVRKLPGERLAPAEGPATVCGLFVETGPNGLALRAEPVRVGGSLPPAMPMV
jgi:metallophosphoesterase (TIGR00282 family)